MRKKGSKRGMFWKIIKAGLIVLILFILFSNNVVVPGLIIIDTINEPTMNINNHIIIYFIVPLALQLLFIHY